MKYGLSVAVLLISFIIGSAFEVSAGGAYLKKRTLVFSIDQGFGNGIIENQDFVGLQRVIDTLKVFQTQYEVYVTLSARQTDKRKLDAVLDRLVQNNIPFVLEVYASDAMTLGRDSINDPYDMQHGRSMSFTQLAAYKTKYGPSFAGIRALEVFSENFTVLACQKLGVDWCDSFKQNLPSDNFYQKNMLGEYMAFAKKRGMFLLFTDFYWSAYHPWDFDLNTVKQPQNEAELRSLVGTYSDTAVVMFANNEPMEVSRTKMDTWLSVVQPYVGYGARGFGLSNQAWMCANEMTCPSDELVKWTTSAFARGALVVQTEPYWYWWNFPKGAIGLQSSPYTQTSQWENRGYPTPNLILLASRLGLQLPSPPSTPTNNAMCVSVNAPEWIKPNTLFTASVTVKNIGTTVWTQNSLSNPNPYRLGAADFKLPPYLTSMWGYPKIELPTASVDPGGVATFSIQSKTPSAEGTYSFSWQMLHDYKEWFGDVCSKPIKVTNSPPPPTNPWGACSSPGKSAVISWVASTGYNTFYLRIKEWPHPADGSVVYWNDQYQGASFTFNSIPGKSYNWWVHTREPLTGEASLSTGGVVSCPSS